MAFELGEKSWKLSLGNGQRAPSRCTVAAGDTTAVLTAISNARARCHLSADAPVYSCYEAGRDGFFGVCVCDAIGFSFRWHPRCASRRGRCPYAGRQSLSLPPRRRKESNQRKRAHTANP
jgi:hypothetical protein